MRGDASESMIRRAMFFATPLCFSTDFLGRWWKMSILSVFTLSDIGTTFRYAANTERAQNPCTTLPASDTLLATSCAMVSNASVAVFCVVAVFGVVPALAIKGVDVSSLVLPSAFQCLRQNGYDFAVIRAWMETGEPDPDSPHTLYNAWHGGMKDVDVYLFPGTRCRYNVCVPASPSSRCIAASLSDTSTLSCYTAGFVRILLMPTLSSNLLCNV